MSKLLKAYDRSRIPLYIQVASVMRQRIEAKQWRPGEKISTLVELEQEFQVARVTVRQAIDILREEGLLHCQQGRGTFVAEKPLSRHWLKLATSWDVLIAPIKDNVPKRIRVDNPPPFPSLREGEGEPARKYVFLRTVQYKHVNPTPSSTCISPATSITAIRARSCSTPRCRCSRAGRTSRSGTRIRPW